MVNNSCALFEKYNFINIGLNNNIITKQIITVTVLKHT